MFCSYGDDNRRVDDGLGESCLKAFLAITVLSMSLYLPGAAFGLSCARPNLDETAIGRVIDLRIVEGEVVVAGVGTITVCCGGGSAGRMRSGPSPRGSSARIIMVCAGEASKRG